MKRGLWTVAAFTALPFLQVIAGNPGYPLPYVRLAAYWLMLATPLLALVAYVASMHPGHVRGLSGTLGLSVYVLTVLTSSIETHLESEKFLGPMGPILLSGVLLFSIALVRRIKATSEFVSVLGLLLLVVPVAQIATGRAPSHASEYDTEPFDLTPTSKPNIYWFVLDGYGREDVLVEEFDFGGQAGFVNDLEQRDFTVSSRSVTPYPMTYLSMSSVLSANYTADEGDEIANLSPFFSVIQGENRVVNTLRSWSYSYIHVPGYGWDGSRCSGVEDVCINPSTIQEAEWALLKGTPFRALLQSELTTTLQRSRADPLPVTQALMDSAARPYFALVHLMNPHPPYVWAGRRCRAVEASGGLSASWGTQRYVDAIRCLNQRVLEAVDRVVESDPDAVIIIQGDHGPARNVNLFSNGDLSQWDAENIWLRFGVLSAMRLPDGCSVPIDLNLANTFRVVLGCLAREEVPLLSSRAWIAHNSPGDLREIDVDMIGQSEH